MTTTEAGCTFSFVTLGTADGSKFLRRVVKEAGSFGPRRWTAKLDADDAFIEFRCEIRARVAGDADREVTVRVEMPEGRKSARADGAVRVAYSGSVNGASTWARMLLMGARFRIGKCGGSQSSTEAGITVRTLYAEFDDFSHVAIGSEVYLHGRSVIAGPFPIYAPGADENASVRS